MTIDCLFDGAREEIVPGEGLLEIHLCVRGRLTMHLPNGSLLAVMQGPSLLFLYQPVGANVAERLEAGMRYTGLSLYCRPSYLSDLLGATASRRFLAARDRGQPGRRGVARAAACFAGLQYVATSLLQSPYQQGFRLMHSEAKALELLCEVLSPGIE